MTFTNKKLKYIHFKHSLNFNVGFLNTTIYKKKLLKTNKQVYQLLLPQIRTIS